MSGRNWDNPEWHEGMTLPSRKDKHSCKKKAKDRTQPQHPALQEIQQAREEATATSAALVLEPEVEPTPDIVPTPEVKRTPEAELPSNVARTPVVPPTSEPDERDLLTGSPTSFEEAEDADGELQPFFKTWQRVLLWIGTILATLIVLAWGKLGYVHNVPDLVRANVPAYNHGTSAYLVLKPWWFGPPVLDLNSYTRDSERPDWDLYKARLGDYSDIVDDPHVLWTFPDDPLQ